MRTYAKSCVRRKSFYSKSELQMLMLSLISGGHICVPKQYTQIWRLHTKSTMVREMFRQITRKLWAT